MTMLEQLSTLDNIKINFSAGGMHAINIVLAFVMFGVALGINPKMFIEIFRKPKSVIVGLFSQMIALPALTFCLVIALSDYISPMVAMGMILVAACPGGNISNFMTQFSKGNAELSVSLTAFTTVTAIVTTPFNFAFWGSMYVNYINRHAGAALRTLSIDVYQMFETVFLLLGLPLIAGILVAKYFPVFTEKIRKYMQYFSILFFILMVVLAFSQNLDIFLNYIHYIFVIVLLHNLLALSTGYSLGTIFKLPHADRRSLTIETGIQNSGLGLVLLFNPKIFPPEVAVGGMVFVAAWWGIWHIFSGLTIASIWSKVEPKK